MGLIDHLNIIGKNPKFSHTHTSENIFWFVFGFGIANKKASKNNSESVELIVNFSNFLNTKFRNGEDYFNWGILLKYVSGSNKDSMDLFNKSFDEFLLIKTHQFTTNLFIKKVDEIVLNTDSFFSVLQYMKDIIENTEQLQFFIYGYNIGNYDSKIEDKELNQYNNNKLKIEEKILKELKLPTYLNCLGQLYNNSYPLNESVKFYIDEVIKYHLHKITHTS